MSQSQSPEKINTPESWEQYTRTQQDPNEGRRRTLPDVGCAMVDATAEIHRRCPALKLFGPDLSAPAIAAAQECYGKAAGFCVAAFDALEHSGPRSASERQ